jgi:hypothetical protein
MRENVGAISLIFSKGSKMANDIYNLITRGEKKPKKEIREIRTRKTHDGKYIHTHLHHHPDVHPDEEHVSSDMSDLHDHFENHAGTPNEGEAETPNLPQLTAAPTPSPEQAPQAPPQGA